jgi:ribulose-phosphate 3-epimerase
MQIIPSVLVQSEEEFIKQITGVQNSVEMIQLDIADGKFVPNTTWADPDVVEQYTNIDVELHLMVQNPLQEVERWTATEVVKRILVHYESVEDFGHTLNELKKYNWEIGVVINPDTSIEKIKPYLSDLQSVMFMGVVPGFQGQGLIPEVLENIVNFNSEYSHIFTEIDGAVNKETLPDIIQTEVKAICPGSAIFGNGDPADNVKDMENIINNLT